MMITSTIVKSRVTNLKPTKNLKQLKKLFNIVSPSIKYAKIFHFVLDFCHEL